MDKLLEQKCPLSKERMMFLFLNYFLGYCFLYPTLMSKLTLWLNPTARMIPQWMQLLVYLWMMISTIYAAYPLLQESVIGMRNHRKTAWKTIMMLLVSYYISSIVVNIIIMQFSDTITSANQSEVVGGLQSFPYLTLFSTLIYAPITEELLFRGVFYRSLRPHLHWWTAAWISAFAFGFIHVMYSLLDGDFADLVYLFSYSLIGFFLAMAYEKCESIYGSILLHFLNNAIACFVLIV